METKERYIKNIFEYLIKKDIPFAVVKNYICLKNESIDLHTNDFFIVIDKDHKSDINGFNFSYSNVHKKTSEHTMSEYEITVFKDINDDFCCVLSNDYGRVYEYKKLSFKKHIDEKYPKDKKKSEVNYVYDEMENKYKRIVGADDSLPRINVEELFAKDKVDETCQNCIFIWLRNRHCFQKKKKVELTNTCPKGKFRKPKN